MFEYELRRPNLGWETAKKSLRRIVGGLSPRQFFKWYHRMQHRQACWFIGSPTYVLTLNIDSQPDVEALPDALDNLAKWDMRAGFSCVGKLIERYPEAHRRIVEAGHELINHTYSHLGNNRARPDRYFGDLTPDQQSGEIQRCHQLSQDLLEYRMVGFRAPSLGRQNGSSVYDALIKLGYTYSSSTIATYTRAWGLPYPVHQEKHRILEIPVGCSVRYPFTIFNTRCSSSGPAPLYHGSGAFIQAFTETLTTVVECDAFLTHFFDTADVMRDGKLGRICALLADRRERDELWLPTYRELVDRVWKECQLF